MFYKKLASLVIAGALMATVGATSAFAAAPVCGLSSCTQSGSHQHDGRTYAAHHTGDGHTYHGGSHRSGHGHGGHHR